MICWIIKNQSYKPPKPTTILVNSQNSDTYSHIQNKHHHMFCKVTKYFAMVVLKNLSETISSGMVIEKILVGVSFFSIIKKIRIAKIH